MIEPKKKGQEEAGVNVNDNLTTPPNHSVAVRPKQVLPSVSPSARGKQTCLIRMKLKETLAVQH